MTEHLEVEHMTDKKTAPFGELTRSLAERFEIAPDELWQTVKAQCFDGGIATDGQVMMLLSFARQYDLNPLARECYAFISKKTGRMSVGVQVDGWTKIANRHRNDNFEFDYDGQEITYENDQNGQLCAITSVTYVKGRKYPTVYRAVLKEWARGTELWQSMPSHQLFIKARNEGIRFAFGVSAYDPDDIERIEQARGIEVQPLAVGDGRHAESDAKSKSQPSPSDAGVETSQPPTASGASESVATPAPPADVSRVHDITPANASAAGSDNQEAAAAAEQEGGTKGGSHPNVKEGAAAAGAKPGRKTKRWKLDDLIAQKVTAARLNLILGQYGVDRVEDLNEAQVGALVTRLERQ